MSKKVRIRRKWFPVGVSDKPDQPVIEGELGESELDWVERHKHILNQGWIVYYQIEVEGDG